MFGPSKDDLKQMLVECWNMLAKARGDKVRYVSIKGGFEWIVVIHNRLDDEAQEIVVALLSSEAEGKQFLNYAKNHPDLLKLWSARKSLGPYTEGWTTNLGHMTYDQWYDMLYQGSADNMAANKSSRPTPLHGAA